MYNAIYIPIWFYSNISPVRNRNTSLYLHSNMVLLKFRFSLRGDRFASNLHSNMVLLKSNGVPYNVAEEHYLHSNMVLLKWNMLIIQIKKELIYIPIWFYSNVICTSVSVFDSSIYIPIWFYSNYNPISLINSFCYLHSNMVLLKSSCTFLVWAPITHLHSNMVLLKWGTNF